MHAKDALSWFEIPAADLSRHALLRDRVEPPDADRDGQRAVRSLLALMSAVSLALDKRRV